VGPTLGEGTYFRVFRSRPSRGLSDGWDFALKTIRPDNKGNRDLATRLERESQAGTEIASTHVVPIIDYRPGAFVVMPRVRGRTLRQIIARSGALAPGVAIWFARQIAEGLKAMHTAGWIHGDVKPENVIVSATGHATLIDLGFVQRAELHLSCGKRRCDRQGTLRYMAPEMLADGVPILPQADLYSLGAILFEMLTGRQLFDQEDTDLVVRRQLACRAPEVKQWVPGLPQRLSQLVAKLLAKDPLRRPWPDSEVLNTLALLEAEQLMPMPCMPQVQAHAS